MACLWIPYAAKVHNAPPLSQGAAQAVCGRGLSVRPVVGGLDGGLMILVYTVRAMRAAVGQVQADHAAQAAGRAIERIEAVSQKYHEAGRHLKNAGRALTGKEAIQKVKPPGKAAKTATVPFRAVRTCFRSLEKSAASAANRLERLEQQKPSIQNTIQQYNRQIAQEKARAVPVKVRPRPHAER